MTVAETKMLQEIAMNRLTNLFGRKSAAHPSTRAALAVEELEDRRLCSLTQILPPPNPHPYNAVCEVRVTFPNGVSEVGSAAMIDSFHALTAAHMLYNAADGGWATSVEVIPDYRAGQVPLYGTAWGTKIRVDSSWIPYSNANPNAGDSGQVEDIGLVTLNSTIGNSSGWFTFGWNSNNSFFTNNTSTWFETAGYPADTALGYNGQSMYVSEGRLTGTSGDDLLSTEGNITNTPGQSGSPLFASSSNIIYGVNSAWSGSTASNSQDYFARITQSVFNWIQSDRESDPAPAAAANSVRATSTGAAVLGGTEMAATNLTAAALTSTNTPNSLAITVSSPGNAPAAIHLTSSDYEVGTTLHAAVSADETAPVGLTAADPAEALDDPIVLDPIAVG